jgi:hypothetical protein
LRDIEKDEEITIYYLGAHENRKTRQEALQARFEFTCSCRLCSLPRKQSKESDKILDDIFLLDDAISRGGIMGIVSAPLRILRYVDRQVHLYNKQGPDDVGLPRAYLDAAQIAIANGDLARGRIFVERAVAGRIVFEGDDSTTVLEQRTLAQNPAKHELFGISKNWKSTVNEVPQGLKSADFEDWLWRREKPKLQGTPGQLAGLRFRETFPRYDELPDKNNIDPDFYESSNGFNYRPRRHWCFLAEIIDYTTFM